MLTRLHVKNYVLIDSLEIDFPEGLIIITGQTGAGKSILLGALSLLMGTKADSSVVSEGADNCVVEADFAVYTDNQEVRSLLEENDVEWENGNLIIRRVVNRSGRSRAFINDSPVSVSVLQELSSYILDVHSQHQTMLLSDRHFQLDILDHYAGNTGLRAECARLWNVLGQTKGELRALEEKLSRLSIEKEYNEAQYSQLESASLRDGELAELEEEQRQLANAESIKTALSSVEEFFSPSSEAQSIDASLKEIDKQLSKAGKYMSSLTELSERIDSCRRELDDIFTEVSSINSRFDVSGSRMEEVEARMSLIYSLMQKHGCRSESELMELKDRLSEELYDSTILEEKRDFLRGKIADFQSEIDAVADQLHEARVRAAASFSKAMTESVRGLELPYAVFEADLSENQLDSSGKDLVVFRFSASGRSAVELAKCASGGELSRIMLALKAMRARYTNMPTMIFDEIDTGVSGSVADKMGTMICEMGTVMQVFAITHLPQVAAKGTAHYLVSKEIDPLTCKAISKIERLSDNRRVLEIARMLSGSSLTDAAVANAESLLGL